MRKKTYKIHHLINDTYQVEDESESVVFQGSMLDCVAYRTDTMLNDPFSSNETAGVQKEKELNVCVSCEG